jgi:hypothetical protein
MDLFLFHGTQKTPQILSKTVTNHLFIFQQAQTRQIDALLRTKNLQAI